MILYIVYFLTVLKYKKDDAYFVKHCILIVLLYSSILEKKCIDYVCYLFTSIRIASKNQKIDITPLSRKLEHA